MLWLIGGAGLLGYMLLKGKKRADEFDVEGFDANTRAEMAALQAEDPAQYQRFTSMVNVPGMYLQSEILADAEMLAEAGYLHLATHLSARQMYGQPG